MPKFAMHNDPLGRKYEKRISATGPSIRERERERMNKACADGHTERGDDQEAGISIFDPVLCELVYLWFSPVGGVVLDPFAGGSVRGIVASELKRKYIGVELRKEQVDENRKQAIKVCKNDPPVWHNGDSIRIKELVGTLETADLIFSCPPYADLEIYSDLQEDISNKKYPEFLTLYRKIISESCSLLKQDSFACFVVGEVRDKKTGNYYNFVGDTIRAFMDAGLEYYNEAILVTSVGSLPIRAGRVFQSTRKIGKTHQNVLVFVKGSGAEAAKKCGAVDLSMSNLTGVAATE